MYDLLHLQGCPGAAQRADLPALRGPYRRQGARAAARAIAASIQLAGLGAFVLGLCAVGSEDLTACLAAAAVTAAGAGIVALGARVGEGGR